jgi:hypothetical protein
MITIHDELLSYKGNFKSNHKKRIRSSEETKTVKKEDIENEMSLSNPGTEDYQGIITGKIGCAVGVKALRYCFMSLLDDHTDAHFTGRLMKIVTEIYHRDLEGVTGKKSIFFSKEKAFLATVVFHIRERNVEMLSYQFECRHSDSRDKAILSMSDLRISFSLIPKSATHYRVLNHLNIISDYVYSEINQRFEPMSLLNTLNGIGFSEYIPVGDILTDEIEVSLPVIDNMPDNVSVIQCVGIVYYTKSGLENFIINSGGSVMVYEVF